MLDTNLSHGKIYMLHVMQDTKELWVHIEITPECGPVKYEFDPQLGLVVDRFMRAPMVYPMPYGYAPYTQCGDGDALDVLVMVPYPIMPTAWIKVRPVAVLIMEDEKGMDEKVLAVPTTDLTDKYQKMIDITDVDEDILERIRYFFERYKDLDKNKWVRVHEWLGAQSAEEVVAASIVRYQSTLVQ